MTLNIIIHASILDAQTIDVITAEIPGELEHCGHYYKLHTKAGVSTNSLNTLRQQVQVDINTLPPDFDPHDVQLLVTDMDSTFINIECVDEIADFADLKPQVHAITEAAMRGELDFEGSLTRRVGLLQGLEQNVLQKVYDERLQLNPGGAAMLECLKSREVKVGLVSGGFTFFTDRLKQKWALDYTRSNTLEIKNGQLTGRVLGGIVGAEAKKDFLLSLCDGLNIRLEQTVAMGDGANDLNMMRQAGLSVAYHAKPKVQAEASAILNYTGLEGVCHLLDINH
jgi:phosphoserine phosphatase